MHVPSIKQVTEFNHGAWAVSAASLILGPVNTTGVQTCALPICKDLCCWQNDTCLSLGELYLLY